MQLIDVRTRGEFKSGHPRSCPYTPQEPGEEEWRDRSGPGYRSLLQVLAAKPAGSFLALQDGMRESVQHDRGLDRLVRPVEIRNGDFTLRSRGDISWRWGSTALYIYSSAAANTIDSRVSSSAAPSTCGTPFSTILGTRLTWYSCARSGNSEITTTSAVTFSDALAKR